MHLRFLAVFAGIAMPVIAFPMQVRCDEVCKCTTAGKEVGVATARGLPCAQGDQKTKDLETREFVQAPDFCVGELLAKYNDAFHGGMSSEFNKYPKCVAGVGSGSDSESS